MKKITLALFTAFTFVNSAYSQVTLNVMAPNANTTTQLRAPNGTKEQANLRGVYLIKASELTALTGSIVNQFSFILADGTSIPVTGTLKIYLENTMNTTYSKSMNFATAIGSMALHYNGTYNIPTNTTAQQVNFGAAPDFTYTGNGIYVAIEWTSAGPYSAANNPATYWASNIGTGNGLGATIYDSLPIPTNANMVATDFRPAFVFRAQNDLSNDVRVSQVDAPGKVSTLLGSAHVINATVFNGGNAVANNVAVGLGVTGANTFIDTKTIASIPAGSFATVSFNQFTPTSQGTNSIVVALPNDQNNTNNTMLWTQSVTCNEIAANPLNPTFTGGYGFSTGNSGIFAVQHTIPVTASLTAIRVGIGTATANPGKQAYAVVLDDQGNILGTSTNTITIASNQQGTFVNFNFPKILLTGGNDYNFGLAQPVGGYFPLATIDPTILVAPVVYNRTALTGGAFSQMTNYDGFFGIEPVLSFSNTTLAVTATPTRVCKGQTTVLNAVGTPTSYTWVNNTGTTTSSIVVSPTVSAPNGQGVVNYSVSGTDPVSGCKTDVAIVQVSVNACAGIVDNNSGPVITVYPNPSVGGITNISGLEGANTISVYNTLGQMVATFKSQTEIATIDLSNQANGNYIVKITNSNNESRIIRMVNQK